MHQVSDYPKLPHNKTLILLSLDFKLADIEIREQLALQQGEERHLYADFNKQFQNEQLVILSTCNRTEIVVCGHTSDPEAIWQWYCVYKSVQTIPQYHVFHNQHAFRHLLSVCCGFESQFVGETQIFAQAKRAYAQAAGMQDLDKNLHFLFQQAFHFAKYIRNQTGINTDSMSLSFTLKKIAESIFGKALPEIAFIGAGEMIQTIAQDLAPAAHFSTFFNRSLERAEKLGKKYQGRAETLERISEIIPNSSIIVSCISLQNPLLCYKQVEALQKKRAYYPLLVLDLGVPRNCQPGIGKIPQVFYYDLQALQKIIDSHLAARKKIVAKSQDLMTSLMWKWQARLQQHQAKKILVAQALAYFEKSLPQAFEATKKLQLKTNFIKLLKYEFFEDKKNHNTIKKSAKPHAQVLGRKVLPCYNWKNELE